MEKQHCLLTLPEKSQLMTLVIAIVLGNEYKAQHNTQVLPCIPVQLKSISRWHKSNSISFFSTIANMFSCLLFFVCVENRILWNHTRKSYWETRIKELYDPYKVQSVKSNVYRAITIGKKRLLASKEKSYQKSSIDHVEKF